MRFLLAVSFILVLVVEEIYACHNPLHGVIYKRKKREASGGGSYEGYNTTSLIDYFTDCMTSVSNVTFDWYSSTEWTINDSYWYYFVDNNDCADEGIDNETNCWLLQVDSFFDESISDDVKECITMFAIDNNYPVTYSETESKKRKKRSTLPRRRNAECPSTIPSAYNTELQRLVPEQNVGRRRFNISNVVTFVDLYTTCTECERYSGEPAVDCYTNRLDLLTRSDSVIKPAIQIANSRYANGGNTVGNCRNNVYKTEWFNVDNPSSGDGDNETLTRIRNLYPKQVCKNPFGIQAEVNRTGAPFGRGNDTLFISPERGLICLNADQTDGRCKNYQVRFCCKDYVGKCGLRNGWTPYYDVSKPNRKWEFERLKKIRKRYRGRVCKSPTAISARLVTGEPYQLTGDVLTISPQTGLFCKRSAQDDNTCGDYKVRFCCPRTVGTCKPGHQWTKWYNNPLTSEGDDQTVRKLRSKPDWHCSSTPSAIKAQLANTRRPYIEGKNRLSYVSARRGLRCENRKQGDGSPCKNYRVSFCCKLKAKKY